MFANSVRFAAKHARKFLDTAVVVEFDHVRVGAAIDFFLADRELILGAACHLMQVRNREHLVVLA